MAFYADEDDRWAVFDQQSHSDFEARRDYGIRIEGPAVYEARFPPTNS